MPRTLLFLLTCLFWTAQLGADTFRFHLLTEPHTLDPQSTSANSGNYLFQNIYRGLYRYHSVRGLILEGAKSCQRSPLVLQCQLNSQHRWSNGEPIVAEDYVRAFRRLIDPEMRSSQAELILNLKNARLIQAGKKPVTDLGVSAVGKNELRFDFDEEDPEFEFKLTNTAMAPWPKSGLPDREKSSDLLTSGPYKISQWKVGHWVRLSANENYGLPAALNRPGLEALFIEQDATAMRLYESGRLNFLRRLTAFDFPRFKKSPELKTLPVARFDYVGFGPELEDYPQFREALIKSVDYSQFMKLYETKSVPGCPSLPRRFMDRQICYSFAPAEAKKLNEAKSHPLKFEMGFSNMGGEDIARFAEWYQGQWKKNLGLTINLKGSEQYVYLRLLRDHPPAVFRKGVSLDRPTCAAALEIFTTNHPENYIRLKDPQYDRLVKQVLEAKSGSEKRVLCRKAIQYLMGLHKLIPQGEIVFNVLAKPTFKGWDLNELNQLDLTDLTEVGVKSKPSSGL